MGIPGTQGSTTISKFRGAVDVKLAWVIRACGSHCC